jgi:hypothetical protein
MGTPRSDGTRAITFSPDDGFGAVAWDVGSGKMLPGAATEVPASPTLSASFHPRDHSLACAITPAGIYFWHIVSEGSSFHLNVIPGVLPGETEDRIALAAGALATLHNSPDPIPPVPTVESVQPATGLLKPEGLALHGLAAAVDVASGCLDPATSAGLLPATSTIANAGDLSSLVHSSSEPLVPPPAPTSAPSPVMPWEKTEPGAGLSTWTDVVLSGVATSWIAQRRYCAHAWLPDGTVVAASVSGWLQVFDPITGRCTGAVPPPATGVRPTSLLSLADGLLVGRSDGRVELRSLPSLEVMGSLNFLNPMPFPMTVNGRGMATLPGAVLAMEASPDYTVVFVSTACAGLFRIDLKPSEEDEPPPDSGTGTVSAAALTRTTSSAKGGVSRTDTGDAGPHGDMSSSVIGVASHVAFGPTSAVIGTSPLNGAALLEPSLAARDGAMAPIVAGIDASGFLSAWQVTPDHCSVIARRCIFEPSALASLGQAVLPPPWVDSEASVSAGTPAATDLATVLPRTTLSRGKSQPVGENRALGMVRTTIGAAMASSTSSIASLTCLATHSKIPLVCVGSSSGCVHLLLAGANDVNGHPVTSLTPSAVAPSLLLTTVAASRVMGGSITAVAFAPTQDLLAVVSDDERHVVFCALHLAESIHEAILEDVQLPGPATLLPVAIASLPDRDQLGGQALVGMSWRTGKSASSGEASLELLLACIDGTIISIPGPPKAVWDSAVAATQTDTEGFGAVSLEEAIHGEGHLWPVNMSHCVSLHRLDTFDEGDNLVNLRACSLSTPDAPLVLSTRSRKGVLLAHPTWRVQPFTPSVVDHVPELTATADCKIDPISLSADVFGPGDTAPLAIDVVLAAEHLMVAHATVTGSVHVRVLSLTRGRDGAMTLSAASSTSPGRTAVCAAFQGTCVSISPCLTRLVVAGPTGTLSVVTLAGPGGSFPTAAVSSAAKDALSLDTATSDLLDRLSALSAAIGPLAAVGNRVIPALSIGRASMGGQPSTVSGSGELAAWKLGVGIASSGGEDGEAGWAQEMTDKKDEPGDGGFHDEYDAHTALDFAQLVLEARAEAAAESFRDELRKRIETVAEAVKEMVRANEAAPELEQLDRDEFDVDVVGSKTFLAETGRMVAEKRDELEHAIEVDIREAEAIKRDCWDTVEAPEAVIRAFKSGSIVHSLAVRKQTAEEKALLTKVSLLRRVEQAELAESAADAVERLADGDIVWPGLTTELPPDADWLVNAGLLPASLDPVKMLQDMEKRKAEEADSDAAAKPKQALEEEEGGDGESRVGRASGWEGGKVVQLLYHPLVCRTPIQRRTQIRLLEQLCRDMARHYNTRFDALRKAKTDDMERIHARTKRMVQILGILKRSEELFEPQLQPEEVPQSVLKVAGEEVGFAPWEDPEEKSRREVEERRKAEEAAKNRDDAPERALDDMMRGTLEEKDEVQRAEDALRLLRQPWMVEAEASLMLRAGIREADGALICAVIQADSFAQPRPEAAPSKELLTEGNAALDSEDGLNGLAEEQRGPWKAYRAAIVNVATLREARRLRLEEELASLKTEVQAIVSEFDSKVEEAREQYRTFRRAILVQELYAHRLAAAVSSTDANIEREQYVLERIAVFSADADRESAAIPVAEKALAEAEASLSRARAADAEEERAFRDALRGKSEVGIDAEQLRRIVDVFLRARHDVAAERAAVSMAFWGRDSRPGAMSLALRVTGEARHIQGGDAGSQASLMSVGTKVRHPTHDPAFGAPRTTPPSFEQLFATLQERACKDPSPDMVPEEIQVGVTVEEAVWVEALNRRRVKVQRELEVEQWEREVGRLRLVLDRLRASLARAKGKVQALEEERTAILRANAITANDVDVLVRLAQGFDEVARLDAIPDYSDAVLVPTRVLERENRMIRRAGRASARRMESVRDAKKDLRYRRWMQQYAEGRLRDREEWLRDVSLLRVTKELQEFVSGADLAQRRKELTVKTEAQARYLKAATIRSSKKQTTAYQRVVSQVRNRREENDRLAEELSELEQAVAVRQGIVAARERGSGGGVGPSARADERMKTLVTRSSLVATAKDQASELDALRQELAKLRRRTFPMFGPSAHT